MKKLLFFCLLPGGLFAQNTLIHCGTLIDGVANEAKSQMTIVVEKNKIIGIEKGYKSAKSGEKVIDLKSKTVMPGLIDCHVHLESETRRGGAIDRFTLNPADIAFESTRNAKNTLLAGFTTVRDLGGSGVNVALRNAINKGLVVGPRIYTSGKSIATTGGHADPTNAYRKDLMGDPGPLEGVVNSKEDARKAVRQRYKDGSDLIKITATGGVLSLASNSQNPQFTEDEIRGIVETAQDYGFTVAAHAHGAEGMKRAIRAGVTSVEHGTYMDDEAIALFKKHGTYLVPTILAGKTVADSARIMGYYTLVQARKALEVGPKIQSMFAKAYKEGVKIAFGTDSGVSIHGVNAKEFEYMVEAGMPAMEAIKAATASASDLLRIKEQIGTIETGKMADIVATSENPLQNIKTMMNVKFVMKDGVVYKNE
ncbi:amidohydrolase family protein [Siphonobacter sp. SORGH_AS_0500]|uniref:metal-dependent hydrolase family protein n=1 Tax=Siphonobacter sp. SORGH_AS_0500 TaxID=1864824 RepID=UPI000CB3F00B|nr:amidohydrolase family protein [Siphonobacter sp. SORGH_AS_0500]MDR6196761.1 imidazolonepropionase-like amidohydrolase [Siphonobacter sp. SORGH_AS_0500]PKK36076.1 amidohydrolase [Siphonobacter sp. SORGH_AS_0500]